MSEQYTSTSKGLFSTRSTVRTTDIDCAVPSVLALKRRFETGSLDISRSSATSVLRPNESVPKVSAFTCNPVGCLDEPVKRPVFELVQSGGILGSSSTFPPISRSTPSFNHVSPTHRMHTSKCTLTFSNFHAPCLTLPKLQENSTAENTFSRNISSNLAGEQQHDSSKGGKSLISIDSHSATFKDTVTFPNLYNPNFGRGFDKNFHRECDDFVGLNNKISMHNDVTASQSDYNFKICYDEIDRETNNEKQVGIANVVHNPLGASCDNTKIINNANSVMDEKFLKIIDNNVIGIKMTDNQNIDATCLENLSINQNNNATVNSVQTTYNKRNASGSLNDDAVVVVSRDNNDHSSNVIKSKTFWNDFFFRDDEVNLCSLSNYEDGLVDIRANFDKNQGAKKKSCNRVTSTELIQAVCGAAKSRVSPINDTIRTPDEDKEEGAVEEISELDYTVISVLVDDSILSVWKSLLARKRGIVRYTQPIQV